MKLTKAQLDHISDAVGDEFGWCEQDAAAATLTGPKVWCWRHMSVWGSGTFCEAAQVVFRAAGTAVEYVLADSASRLDGECGCYTCIEERAQAISNPTQRLSFRSRMIVCAQCGNKRCPHATDHRLNCTGSNDSGQEGSNYQ